MDKLKPNRWTRYHLLFEGEHFIFKGEEYRRKNAHFAYRLSTGERVDFRAADKVDVLRYPGAEIKGGGIAYVRSGLKKYPEATSEQEKEKAG